MTSIDVATLPVEAYPVDKLIPYERNAKKHPPEQIKRLAASIKVYGITPLMIEPDGTIITGHGRRLAAIDLGLANVPVIVRHDLTKEQAAALRLSDNKTASNEWDLDLLKEEAVTLQELGIDMSTLGFTEKELDFTVAELGDFDETVFVDDITAAVETQKTENAAKEKEVDSTAAPLADAFGFKRVSVEQSRTIRGFMNRIEEMTSKKGADALVDYISEHA